MNELEWVCAFILVVAGAVGIGIVGYVFIDVLEKGVKRARHWIARRAQSWI
jgi:hypothetical protein